MKFEGGVYVPTGNEPMGLVEFMAHYQKVSRFLVESNSRRIGMSTDVLNSVERVLVVHGVPNTFSHRLGRTPLAAILVSGRSVFVKTLSLTTNSMTALIKLHMVNMVNPQPNRAADRIAVDDTTFFVVGDRIKVGNNVRTLKGIDKGVLVLDGTVTYDSSVNTLSLSTESITFLFV